MATNARDVQLNVAIETTGEKELAALSEDLRKLTTATKAARDAEAIATREQREAAAALNERRTALERFRVENGSAARSSAELSEQERRLRVAVVDARESLRLKTTAVQAAAATSREAVAAEKSTETQLKRVRAEYVATGSAARTAAQQQAQAAATVAGPLETLKGQLSAVRNVAVLALGGGLVGGLARDLSQTADAAASLRARLSLVAGEGESLERAYQGVLDVAQRTGSALETTGELFARIATAGREFNLSQQDALRLTETIGQAVAVSGAAAASSDAALTQLIQGLQSGVLRGEEFNSVLEQSPRLARALADGLGVTTGELRELSKQGALTTDVVIKALQGQAAAIESEFGRLPLTVGRAITNLSTSFTAYVSEVDRANGVSAAAAAALDALAKNLDTVGAVLAAAGKAAAAYAAVKLAQSFIESATAARGLATATAAATAATVANTAATTANNAAQATSVATVGRLAGLLGTLKLTALLGVLTNLRGIGTALGEGAAKLMGYRDRTEELEAVQRAQAEASRMQAQQTAAFAAAAAQASDRALGLTKEARGLADGFTAAQKAGKTAAEAVADLSKALQLGDVSGIQAAGAALDALGVRGKATGEQVREALAGALKGIDLGLFETQARAAFDSTEQGARRLALALDAIADESLRRVGTSVRELETGFNAASASAINDVAALAQTLEGLGVDADEAGRLLGVALDKATAAASTERAAAAVVETVKELGREGKLAGEALGKALADAQRRLDDLRPGVNSLAEAFRTLGVKTREELQDTADKLGEAYRVISTSGQASMQQQVEAYQRWRAAALAASGGVETAQLKLQRVILENRGALTDLGEAGKRGMDKVADATRRATSAMERQAQVSRTAGNAGPQGIPDRDADGRTPDQLARLKQQGGPIDATYNFDVYDRLFNPNNKRGFSPDEIPALENGLRASLDNVRLGANSLIPDTATMRDDQMWVGVFRKALDSARAQQQGVPEVRGVVQRFDPMTGKPLAGASQAGPQAGAGGWATQGGYEIRFVLGGEAHTVAARDQAAAERLVNQLQEAFRQAGGG